MTPEPQLFLAFPLTSHLLHLLDDIPIEKSQIFINSQSATCLEKYIDTGGQYLGKRIGQSTNLQSLQQVEKNIYSILQKLIPDYPCQSDPLKLLVISKL